MKVENPERIIEDLFYNHFRSLVSISFHIIKDYEQAEDIVQDVFVKVLQNLHKIEHAKNLKSYLQQAVKNSTLNFLRDQKFNKTNTISIENIEIEAGMSDTNSKEPDLSLMLHRAVDGLPDKWREAFILSKYEKLKYYEIAERMDVSNKTVEKYISKAFLYLRRELKYLISLLLFFIIKV